MSTSAQNPLTFALSKGRILSESVPLLAAAGIEPTEALSKTRKLIIETTRSDVRLLLIRAQDVPTYVAYGAADLGVSGKDVLMERGGDGLYEPLDLKIAKCRLMVAGDPARLATGKRLRVATKYATVTREYYAQKNTQVEIIKLYGSMELAPLVGLADRIVDLVDTGRTLKANGLAPLEHIADISARLVVNKGAMKMRSREIKDLIAKLSAAVDARC